ncbi:hypothetical protein BG58_16440 [Caballeronia jiangsuensis]|nr:hypothetical protein BG58_16440 [Caballeronia jiangsuensis]
MTNATRSPHQPKICQVAACRDASRLLLHLLFCLLIAAAPARSLGQDTASAAAPLVLSYTELREIVKVQIDTGRLPGAVVAIGDSTHLETLIAMGYRARSPHLEPMTVDTLFDLASLTKVVATTTAVLQLAELGLLNLDMPVARYWPAFAVHDKTEVTVRELLTHMSGLPAELPRLASNARAVRDDLAAVRLIATPGEREIYSDVNFAVLGELVRRVSGRPLDAWCREHIFAPLGMRDTGFGVDGSRRSRTAPTTADTLGMRRGRVHDPLASALGGVAGDAGVFSTAADLSRFAQMLLNGGRLDGFRVLRQASVDALLTPSAARPPWYGLGWKAVAPLVANRDRLVPVGGIVHTGYTGTALWIDFVTRRFLIVLSNRVHPDDRGDARPLREQVSALIASIAPARNDAAIARQLPYLANRIAQTRQLPITSSDSSRVRTGIDVLRDAGFKPLAGLRIGLVTNRSGFDAEGTRTIDLLARAPGVRLAAIFVPEHGLAIDTDAPFHDSLDVATGLPVHSLYDTAEATHHIAPETIAGLNALVFDLQDAGVRFFTYESTLGYVLEAASARHIPVFVLDRPDPLGGDRMGGPMSEAQHDSFTNYQPLPLLPAMTIGELATLFNAQRKIGADLRVIKMTGYARAQRFEDTGLAWVPPSPNLRTPVALDRYPDLGLLEGANVSVGRGTPQPFERIGAPWIDGELLATVLHTQYAQASFEPFDFVPTESTWRGRLCHGVRIVDAARDRVPGSLGIALIVALHKLYPERFHLAATREAIGSRAVYDAIARGGDIETATALAAKAAQHFVEQRSAALLY